MREGSDLLMMRALLAGRWPTGLFHALLGLCLVGALVSCTGGTKMLTTGNATSASTPPPITLVEIKGLPPAKAEMLTGFMAEAAGKHDIAIVQGSFGDGYRLDGAFKLQTTDKGIVLAHNWTLSDGKGRQLHAFSEQEPAGVAAGDPWAAADADLLRRVAETAANDLARRLSELGFATRATPPS
jgi:hypothetical protein